MATYEIADPFNRGWSGSCGIAVDAPRSHDSNRNSTKEPNSREQSPVTAVLAVSRLAP